MKDTKLLTQSKSALARALLRSARSDAPREGSADRALATLLGGAAGAGVGTGGASAAAAATKGAATTAAGGLAAGGGAGGAFGAASVGAGGLALAKWIGIGVIAMGAVTASMTLPDRLEEPRPTVPPVVSVAAPPPSPMQTSLAPVALAVPEQEPERPVAPPPVAPVPARASSATPASSASILAVETAALDEARAKIASGDPNGALALLDAFDARHPRAMLRDEAVVLRIESLAASGERARATALARSFLAQHPESPYARRLRSRLDLGTAP